MTHATTEIDPELTQMLEETLTNALTPIAAQFKTLNTQIQQLHTLTELKTQLDQLAIDLKQISQTSSQASQLNTKLNQNMEMVKMLAAWVEQMQAEMMEMNASLNTPPVSTPPRVEVKIRLLPLAAIISALFLLQTLAIAAIVQLHPTLPTTHLERQR